MKIILNIFFILFLLIQTLFSQSYSSGGNTTFNSWSVFQANSPGNIYGNRYNCINVNRDSIVFRTKYLMLDSMYLTNSSVVAGAKAAWLNGRRMMLSKFDSVPLTSRQVTLALGFLPINSSYTPTLTLSGQSLTAGGNTVVIATQTTVLTSVQVTTALGFVPATNTVVSDKTVAISSANSNLSITSSYPNFTLTPYTPTTFTASRAVNGSTFQPSSTKMAFVFYTIRVNATSSIGSASSATVSLQYSADNGSTWIDIGQIENSPSVSVAAAVSLSDTQAYQLSGIIPAGAIVRINQASTGSTTITFIRGQETF